MPFHCLDCSSIQFFNIHRHNAIRDATIDLLNSVASSHTSILSVSPKEPFVLPPTDDTRFPSLRDEAAAYNTSIRTALRQSVQDYRTSRAFARNSGQTRADCGLITTTNRRYIDITYSNLAACAASETPTATLSPSPGYPGSFFRSAPPPNGPDNAQSSAT
jgi:hypothetical protein